MANCNVATKVAYFVAGVGIGAAVALLFAPLSGEETRKRIIEKAQDGKDYVASKGREIRKEAEDLVDQGKELVTKQKARLADVLESGKQAARETFAR
ncbi:MAG: YtxH domain-containing protein [Terriglobia bacterium]|jgi:gas vesicle protein